MTLQNPILRRLLLVGACLIAIPAAMSTLGANAAQDEMQIGDQPGYVPAPTDEHLEGPLERQVVFFRTTEPPGSIVVHTNERFLYLVQENNRAMRYGIGVGRDGFQWAGQHKISRKQEWPAGGRRRR